MSTNNGFVLTSFGNELDINIKRLAAQAKSRYWANRYHYNKYQYFKSVDPITLSSASQI